MQVVPHRPLPPPTPSRAVTVLTAPRRIDRFEAPNVLRATARPMLPIQPAALHWARPADTGPPLRCLRARCPIPRNAVLFLLSPSARANNLRGPRQCAELRAAHTGADASRVSAPASRARPRRAHKPTAQWAGHTEPSERERAAQSASPVQCCRQYRQHWPSGRAEGQPGPRALGAQRGSPVREPGAPAPTNSNFRTMPGVSTGGMRGYEPPYRVVVSTARRSLYVITYTRS